MRRDVLEDNVRRLLRRSYVPALPAPAFRDRLEALVRAELERRWAPRAARAARAPRRTPGRALPARAWLALAAAVLGTLVGWRVLGSAEPPARERLVMRGAIALGLADGTWRAADDEERFHGVQVSVLPLRVLTPTAAGIDLLVAQGRLRLEPGSELGLAQAPAGVAARLDAGAAEFVCGAERLVLVPGRSTVLAPSTVGAALAQPEAGAREARPAAPAPVAPPAVSAVRVFGGRVTADGLPLGAFSVALLRERTEHATHPPEVREFTAADGFFEWPDPPRGKQRVFVHAPGFALCALGEHDFSAAPPELSAELVPGVTLRGSVLDPEGNPVPGALVHAEDEAPTDGLLFLHSERYFWLPVRAETGADGRFELAHVTPGSRTLRVEAEGFAPAWVDGVQADGTAREELVVRLGRGGTLEGRVERDDGGPWAEAEVVVVAMDQHLRSRQSVGLTRTDGEGRYRFEHLPPLPMLAVLLRSDVRPDVRPVQIETGASARCDFPAPRQGIRLHGILRLADGRPAAQRNLGLFDSETSSWNQDWVASTTGPDGSYVFEGVEPGPYALYLVDQLGRSLRCLDEHTLAPTPLDVQHDLVVPGASLEVVARAAQDDAPVAQAALMLMRIGDDGRATFAGYEILANGSARLGELRPGRYLVQAYPMVAGLGHVQSEPFEVVDGRPSTLTLVHEPGGSARIVVRGADGRPLEGASVVFRDAEGEEHQFSRVPMTDADGLYVAQGLRPGRYRVVVELEGFARAIVPFDFQLGHEPEIPVVLSPRAPR
ncbi:MAG TPA: carboxypeptidase-like regulatory domain-containing protein [Planctomycetota bacterium]